MALAIEEGKKGAGFVSPNPLVGCVILDRDGGLLAKGHHARYGDLHAETHALKQIADRTALAGAHLYVTLEPCAHEGRQPSCAKILAELPLASVTYGLRDPNPLVNGRGAEILRASGKKVELFPGLSRELESLAEVFLTNVRLRRPYVALKIAASLDAQVAAADGRSQWITGEEARARGRYFRGIYDAVLTGVGTFLRDDPRLDAREGPFAEKKQRVILLDPAGQSLGKLATSRLLSCRSPDDVYLVTAPGVGPGGAVQHMQIPTGADGFFSPLDLLTPLMTRDIRSVLIEAGPVTASAFLRQGLIDKIFLFIAPKILGRGRSWTEGMDIGGLGQAVGLEIRNCEQLGPDLLLTLGPAQGPSR